MPKSLDKPLDLQYSLPMTYTEKTDPELHRESTIPDELDLFTTGMAGTDGSSPFIKDEPDDMNFLHNYPPSHQGFNMPIHQQFGQPQTSSHDMNSTHMSLPNGNYGQLGMDPPQQMSHSFNMGMSGIGDDELLDLDLNNDAAQHPNFASGQPGLAQGNNMQFFQAQGQQPANRQINTQLSSTPDGAPIQSPFVQNGFNYAAFNVPQSMTHTSPPMRPTAGNPFPGSRTSHVAPNMHRQTSDSRSPMTPKTPGISNLHLETPQSGSLPTQPINYATEHQKRTSGQWDGNPDSLHSQADTPISSPNYHVNQKQMAEMLKSGKHASLPAKVEPGYGNPQSQEAKRRRRRESHNLVERRRRDNINEKIQELSHLVPLHRLEDEKVRKHIMNNSPMSPSLTATGMSPPQATSLLAGGGRRATSGSISLGIPPEDKDKGPNKGDILNGSVSWTRDLMWALYQKYLQEEELAEQLANLGGQWPFQQSEDEKRMRAEVMAAMEANNPNSFAYTRGPGSGLRVPGHTNTAGEPLDAPHMGTISPQSLSPADPTGMYNPNDASVGSDMQPWNQALKEEEEFGMQLT